ncbi:MAG: sodium:calcium antiporter [Acidaminococcaceae bacterium]
MIWIAFAVCAFTIIYSGSKLSKYGDVIAEKSGLGGSLIGLVMLASVTSLPELVTGVSAVTFANSPDIAAGDVIGSCVFNLFILAAILDAIHKPLPISAKANYSHILSAACGLLLLTLIAFAMTFPQYNIPIKWIGSSSILFVFIYFSALKLVRAYEKKQIKMQLEQLAEALKYSDISMREATLKYVVNAFLVICAAVFLPKIGEQMAHLTGLGEAFIGNIFIAFTSSLPEVVVSIAAVRIGSVDLAIGNVFGSNIFNIFILFIDDLFFTQGPLLQFISPIHVISVFAAIIMTATSIIGLAYKAEKKKLIWGWDSIIMIVVFIISIGLLYYQT